MKKAVDQLDYSKFIEDTLEMELIVNDINRRRNLNHCERVYNYVERRKFLLKLKLIRLKIKRLEKEKAKKLTLNKTLK